MSPSISAPHASSSRHAAGAWWPTSAGRAERTTRLPVPTTVAISSRSRRSADESAVTLMARSHLEPRTVGRRVIADLARHVLAPLRVVAPEGGQERRRVVLVDGRGPGRAGPCGAGPSGAGPGRP